MLQTLDIVMKQDIEHKLKKDFGENFHFVLQRINIWDAEVKGLLDDRIVRSVLFLADGDLEKYEHYETAARTDFRDVLWQAEYDEPNGERKRDFSRVFEQSEI